MTKLQNKNFLEMRLSNIAILLLLLCVSLPLNAQNKTYPDTPEARIQYIKDEFGGIPLIICNEKELSIEKFAELDLKYFGTCVFLNVKSLAEELAGEKGKNGLIYLHAEREHLLLRVGISERGIFLPNFQKERIVYFSS